MHKAPRKRFGQNFLTNSGIISRIIEGVAPREGEHIVEIGPGRGALTEHLARSGAKLSVVEIDRDLIAALPQQSWWGSHCELHAGDALKLDFQQLQPQPLRIVGNLPYNISTPLLFHLLSASEAVADMHLMLQKEVVQRLCARPGTAAWGRLSVAAQLRAQMQLLLDVPPHAFFPAPKVQSQVVRVQPRQPQPTLPSSLDGLLRAAFGARRKTLRKALSAQVRPEIWTTVDIDPGRRAEVLELEEWLSLGRAVDAAGYTES